MARKQHRKKNAQKCWDGYHKVKGKRRGERGSCAANALAPHALLENPWQVLNSAFAPAAHGAPF